MIGTILTDQQKDALIGKDYAPGKKFEPIKDNRGRWVLDENIIDQCAGEFQYLKGLTKSVYFLPKN